MATQRDKLIQKIRARPPEADFGDVRKLLEAFGWEQRRQTGSHVIFRDANGRGILTVPLKGGRRVKTKYLDIICERLGWTTGMATTTNGARKPLEHYLGLAYPFNVYADPEGGYVAEFPDLPGCVTQADTLQELIEMAEDARVGWIETVYEDGQDIPEPSYPEEYSGKLNLRLPRSLHRQLAESAERDGVSLNQHIVHLLSRGDAQARIERSLHDLEQRLQPAP
ncbi:MAG: type II toxin-antitoxin system HicA family toxin [Chloroflexota bacterium]